MKNWKHGLIMAVIAIIALAFAFTACSGGGGKSLNSAEALKEYLDKQPANDPDKPVKVSMRVNDMMIENVMEVIENAGKYVSLDLSKSTGLTVIDVNVEALVSITIPNSVTDIDRLSGPNLTEINLVAGNTNFTIEGGILYNKAKTEIVAVPSGISGAVTIPEGVTGIDDRAFSGRKNLTSVTIPNSVTYIGERTFSGSGLTGVTIGNGVTEIDTSAFRYCENLTSITIPNSVTYIGGYAFGSCTSLTSVTFQGSVNQLGEYSDRGGYFWRPFDGDLREKYLAEGIGTYTRPANGNTWTKQ